MNSALSIIPELEGALNSGSAEKRVDTLRRVTELFLNDADRLGEEQVNLFGDVLTRMIEHVESKALAELSASLSTVDKAPAAAVRQLARHDEIDVAGPVLRRSNKLTESDLLEIAGAKGQKHLLEISGRDKLSESLTDVLVRRGDREVSRTLAGNSGARFSQSGYATLVQRAATDDVLSESLGGRADIPPRVLQQLLEQATETVRTKLLAAASPQQRLKVQQALAAVSQEVKKTVAAPRDLAGAQAIIQEINRNGRLNEATIVEFARQKKLGEVIASLALLCAVPAESIERVTENPKQDGLLVACKAANLSWPTVSIILRNRFGQRSHQLESLDQAEKAYSMLSPTTAQRTMRFMRVREVVAKA